MNPFDERKIKRILIDVNKFSYKTKIPTHIIESVKVDAVLDMMADGYIVDLSTYLAGNKKETRVVTKKHYAPKNLMDYIKQEFFPVFLLKYFSINYEEIVITEHFTTYYHICPHIDIPSNSPDHLHFMVMD